MRKPMHTPKTNALRQLDAKKIPYQTHTYEAPTGFLDGVSVARSLGQNPDQVYKTLVIQGAGHQHYVCVIPVACELDLKKAAKHFGEKKVEMIPSKEITSVTGYIKGGCSPVGMKKCFPTAIHRSASHLHQLIVSGGLVGLQMELAPDALCQMIGAQYADLTVQQGDL